MKKLTIEIWTPEEKLPALDGDRIFYLERFSDSWCCGDVLYSDTEAYVYDPNRIDPHLKIKEVKYWCYPPEVEK